MASSLEKYGWYEWLCHTNFSFLVGASHPEEFVNRAVKLGYRGLGLVDYDGVYGIVRAFRALKKLGKEGEAALRLFYGAELHLKKDHLKPVLYQDTISLIAKSRQGYRNLCSLISYAHRNGKNEANLSLAELSDFPVDDIVCVQPMRGLLRGGYIDEYKNRCERLGEVFGTNFYFAISRHLNPSEDCWIRATIKLARDLEKQVLFSQDPYFHDQGQKDLSDLLHAIRLNRTVSNVVDHMFVNGERCLQPLDLLAERYGSIPGYSEALRAGHELAQGIHFDLDELRYFYPKEMIPDGLSADNYLEKLTLEGARARYGEMIPEKISGLLQKEIQLVRHLGFADYFLTVWDIVRWAREKRILCQGRGSAANSAICFVLGITSVDPIAFDLLFERFISVERGDPPDIDIDFEHERREEVIQHIYDFYGRDKAAMVANVITFRPRGAIRSVGKALGVPEVLLSEAARLQEAREYRRDGSEASLEALQKEFGSADDAVLWRLWGEFSERLTGFPHHMGIHSGGFILSDRTIDWLVAREPATMVGRTVIQWSKEDIEALGFFKIDVLALGMLTVIRKTFDLVEVNYGDRLTLASLPADDPKTFSMIQRADTVGVFQIESRAQMSMLPRLRPATFYDLVVQVGIIRPGPIQGGLIHPYLKRRDGLETVVYADPRLEPILRRTLGVPIFQEQVMRIAMAIGSFSPGEADELRRHIGCWSIRDSFGPMVQRLQEGMRRNKITEAFIKQIIGHLRGFADYGFPESHAVSFALLAYASAYLKCHYPAAFFTALFNSQPMGFYSRHALIQAAIRDGVAVLPISVTSSNWDAGLEAKADEKGLAIRLGFNMVRGLSANAAKAMVIRRDARGGWPTRSEFLQNSGLYRSDLVSLAAAGALVDYGLDRRSAIWLAEAAPFAPLINEEELAYRFPKEGVMESIERDFDAFETSLGAHPVKVIKAECWFYSVPTEQVVLSRFLGKMPPGRNVVVFGMVLVRQAPYTAKGMVFFTLEDESGFINLVFTPPVYEKYQRLINGQGFLCAEGKLQSKNEGHSVLVGRIIPLTVKAAEVIDLDQGEQIKNSRKKVPGKLVKARNYM